MHALTTLERTIRRDRLLLGIGLAAVTGFAWISLLRMAATMNAMSVDAQMHVAMGMPDPRAWGVSDWFALFVMWSVMMVAMMLPSAAPVILLVLDVYRRRANTQARLAAVVFTVGYAAVWMTFGAAAAAVQVALHRASLLAPDMRLDSGLVAGSVLIAAGIYQWLPIKGRCLTHCQSPLALLAQHWKEGVGGGFSIGVHHGVFCVGCCWMLMMLLFVVGLMNVVWVALLTAFVLVEKLLRTDKWVSRVAGVSMAGWGLYMVLF